jgi:hypothetical protein
VEEDDMKASQRIVGGVLAVAMGVLVGCSSTPSTQTQLRTNEAVAPTTAQLDSDAAFSEDTLTPAEEGLNQERSGYQVQQFHNYWHNDNRCRWYYVPSSWGWPYQTNWDSGRWVLVCSRRQIPYWWYAGAYGTYNNRPRFRPHFPDRFRQFDRDHDRGRGGDRDRDRDNRGGGGGGRDNDGPRGGMGGRDNDGPRGGMGGGGGRMGGGPR